MPFGKEKFKKLVSTKEGYIKLVKRYYKSYARVSAVLDHRSK